MKAEKTLVKLAPKQYYTVYVSCCTCGDDLCVVTVPWDGFVTYDMPESCPNCELDR